MNSNLTPLTLLMSLMLLGTKAFRLCTYADVGGMLLSQLSRGDVYAQVLLLGGRAHSLYAS